MLTYISSLRGENWLWKTLFVQDEIKFINKYIENK